MPALRRLLMGPIPFWLLVLLLNALVRLIYGITLFQLLLGLAQAGSPA